MRKAVAVITLAGIAGSITLTHTSKASAQNVNVVTPTAKGIIGCALLGAETVTLIQAAAGARPRWAYIVFPLLGAAAGGVGGYFLEDAAAAGTDTTLTAVNVGTLVLGLGLVVPSVIAYVNATAYRPENDQPSDDNTPAAGPIDESTAPADSTSQPASGGAAQPADSGSGSGSGTGTGTGNQSSVHPRRIGTAMRASPMLRPTGLVDFARGSMSLSVPAISVENSVSLQDMRQYGLSPQSELRVPVLSGSF